MLYLQGNHISKIEGLENLQNLVVLNLGNNPIKRVENIRHLKKLENLDLRHCLLEDIASLDEVSELDSLINLNVTDNALEGITGYYINQPQANSKTCSWY